MKLPAIPHPERYAGLFIYDFGTHVSVGYTALEIRVLRESEAHRGGTAYQIYRAGSDGTLDLRGVLDERLTAREAICFLRADGATARRDYEALLAAADHDPAPCGAEMLLTELQEFDPPHATALLYPAAASAAMAAWLARSAPHAGDRVVGGIDVYAAVTSTNQGRLASCRVPSLIEYADRPPEEVVRTIHEPLQR